MPFSNRVKMKLLLLFILDFINQLLFLRKRLKIFNFIHKEEQVHKMSLEEVEVEEMILMMKKDLKKLERKLIENFLFGLKHVMNLLVINLLLKFLTETKDFMEHHSRVIA